MEYLARLRSRGPSSFLFDGWRKELHKEMKDLRGVRLVKWQEANWRRWAILNEKGKVILPANMFKLAFHEACRHLRRDLSFVKGKKQAIRIIDPKYTSTMDFRDSTFSCDVKQLKMWNMCMCCISMIDGEIPAGKLRPILERWKTDIKISDPLGKLKTQEIADMLNFAGRFVGVGSGRWQGMGSFELEFIKRI